MSGLDMLLKRLRDGYVGEELAKENFEYNKNVLFERLAALDKLCESTEWNSSKYGEHRAELSAYLAAGRKLVGYEKQ